MDPEVIHVVTVLMKMDLLETYFKIKDILDELMLLHLSISKYKILEYFDIIFFLF